MSPSTLPQGERGVTPFGRGSGGLFVLLVSATMEREEPGYGGAPVFHPIGRVTLYLALFLLLQVLIGVPAILLWLALTGTSPETVAGGEIPVAAVLVVYVTLVPVMVPATVVFLHRLDRRPLASIGARWPDRGLDQVAREAGVAALGAGALLLVWLAVVAVVADVQLGGVSESFRSGHAWFPGATPGPMGGVVGLVVYCLGFLVQGGLEEWIFRGYIYRALRERWSWATAACATAVLFALIHGGNPGVELAGLVNTFLLGIVLGAIVEGTGTLWAAAVAHGVWNYAMSSLLALPVSGGEVWGLLSIELEGPEWATGGAYGPEGSWLLTGLIVVVILGLARWVDQKV